MSTKINLLVAVTSTTVAPTMAPRGKVLKAGGNCTLVAGTNANLFGVNLVGDFGGNVDDDGDYLRVFGDGATTVFSSADYPSLLQAVATATPDGTDTLNVVCLVNGVPIARNTAGSSPSANQFKISGTTPRLLTLGSTYAAGTKIELSMNGVITQYNPRAGEPLDAIGSDVFSAVSDAVVVSA